MKCLIISLTLAAICFTTGNSDNMRGKFETKSGSVCEWKEEVYSRESRAFAMDCICSDPDGKRITYSCEYEGNPSRCDLFGVDGGPDRFYHLLAHHFEGIMATV